MWTVLVTGMWLISDGLKGGIGYRRMSRVPVFIDGIGRKCNHSETGDIHRVVMDHETLNGGKIVTNRMRINILSEKLHIIIPSAGHCSLSEACHSHLKPNHFIRFIIVKCSNPLCDNIWCPLRMLWSKWSHLVVSVTMFDSCPRMIARSQL